MIVAGGTYVERSVSPPAKHLFGSGGRSVLALRNLVPIEFHTFFPRSAEIEANFGKHSQVYKSEQIIEFDYLHSLSHPDQSPYRYTRKTVDLKGRAALVFGCVEGDFSIKADRVVFDPQGGCSPFRVSGLSAKRFAICLNEVEAKSIGRSDDLLNASRSLLKRSAAEVIVVKCGPKGAYIFQDDLSSPDFVLACKTRSLSKIGSGDVFSAMFSYYWCERNMAPAMAADLASRQVADYVETAIISRPETPPNFHRVTGEPEKMNVLIAADENSMITDLALEQARRSLIGLGVRHVTKANASDITEYSFGNSLSEFHSFLIICNQDIDKIVPLVNIAAKAGLPTIIFAETHAEELQLLLEGKNIEVLEDFAASMYTAIWSGR